MKTHSFRNIQILFYSLLLGQLILAGVAYFLNRGKDPSDASMTNADFAFAVPAVLLAGFLGAYLIDKRRAASPPIKAEIGQKLEHYQTSVLIRSALLEAPNLLSAIAYLLSGEQIYLIYFALGIGAFLMFRPTLSQLQQRYMIKASEMENVP